MNLLSGPERTIYKNVWIWSGNANSHLRGPGPEKSRFFQVLPHRGQRSVWTGFPESSTAETGVPHFGHSLKARTAGSGMRTIHILRLHGANHPGGSVPRVELRTLLLTLRYCDGRVLRLFFMVQSTMHAGFFPCNLRGTAGSGRWNLRRFID